MKLKDNFIIDHRIRINNLSKIDKYAPKYKHMDIQSFFKSPALGFNSGIIKFELWDK